MRVRGQRLAMVVKGGGSWRRDYCDRSQRGVIMAAAAYWIWTTKMHATECSGKQEDGSTMCSNTLYMYNVDAGSSLSWLSASTKT